MQGATVFVIDDEPAIRELLGAVLTDEGYQPVLLTGGQEALEHLQAGQIPDAMLLDLLMPSVDGYAVLEYLRRNLLQELPVLVFSAQQPTSALLDVLDVELRDFISKPFDIAELLVRLSRLLRRSPRGAAVGSGTLRVHALGSLRVYRDDTLLFDEGWRNKPAKLIFKLLFTGRGRRYPKDILAEHLWPDADPDAVANRLRVAVHELRKHLGGKDSQPVICQQEGAYFFSGDANVWSDVDAFDQWVAEGKSRSAADDDEAALDAYRSAEALYQGDYLRDDPYQEWAVATRERLREEHLTMLADVARIDAKLGRPEEAAQALFYLATPLSSYTTGSHIDVSGGVARHV